MDEAGLLSGNDDRPVLVVDPAAMSIDAPRSRDQPFGDVVADPARFGGPHPEPGSARRALRALRGGIARRPLLEQLYQLLLAGAGFATVAVGLVLVPLPGPGWVVVFGGLSLLSARFAWARSARERLLLLLQRAARWYGSLPRLCRAALTAAGGLVVSAGAWACVAVLGLPGWLPQGWLTTARSVPGW